MKQYLFTGAGNNFVVMDGREGGVEAFRDPARIGELCRLYSTDGLMLLLESADLDFEMEFYNPDGSGGMMCGNGGRCIVAFADYLGLKPRDGKTWHFRAADGEHNASILSREGQLWTVRLKMVDVHGITPVGDGLFLNTGTRHFVKFVPDVDAIDVEKEGRQLRWDPVFAPEGTNVNFVHERDGVLWVRTFEKGVEGETLACGTGLTASALAAWYRKEGAEGDGQYSLYCRRGDRLDVSFRRVVEPGRYDQIYLTGPAELIRTV